jgi:hypothetical protein
MPCFLFRMSKLRKTWVSGAYVVQDVDDGPVALLDDVVELADVAEHDGDLPCVVGHEVLWGQPGLLEISKEVMRSMMKPGMSIDIFSIEREISLFSRILFRKSIFLSMSAWVTWAYVSHAHQPKEQNDEQGADLSDPEHAGEALPRVDRQVSVADQSMVTGGYDPQLMVSMRMAKRASMGKGTLTREEVTKICSELRGRTSRWGRASKRVAMMAVNSESAAG